MHINTYHLTTSQNQRIVVREHFTPSHLGELSARTGDRLLTDMTADQLEAMGNVIVTIQSRKEGRGEREVNASIDYTANPGMMRMGQFANVATRIGAFVGFGTSQSDNSPPIASFPDPIHDAFQPTLLGDFARFIGHCIGCGVDVSYWAACSVAKGIVAGCKAGYAHWRDRRQHQPVPSDTPSASPTPRAACIRRPPSSAQMARTFSNESVPPTSDEFNSPALMALG